MNETLNQWVDLFDDQPFPCEIRYDGAAGLICHPDRTAEVPINILENNVSIYLNMAASKSLMAVNPRNLVLERFSGH